MRRRNTLCHLRHTSCCCHFCIAAFDHHSFNFPTPSMPISLSAGADAHCKTTGSQVYVASAQMYNSTASAGCWGQDVVPSNVPTSKVLI